jgi:diacylglycerol kinase (ATP)
MKKILLLVNSKARTGEGAFSEISKALKEAGYEVYPKNEQDRNQDFRKLIHEHHHVVDGVIVGGGDGTINYTLPSLAYTKIPLIIYPLGTANLFARSFDIKATPQDLIELLKTGKLKSIDLGMVNDKYFINVCGLGISTEVNKNVSSRLKRFTGPFSFWITGLMRLRSIRPIKMKLSVDNQMPIFTLTWQITICNGRKYGAWMTIEKEASYDDETLHCLSTEVQKTWDGLKLLPCYIKGEYKDQNEVNLLAGKEIRIETKRPFKIDVDGDIQIQTPAVFKVAPKALRIILPSSSLVESAPINIQ